MARDLPYYKFFVSEWTNGRITLCDYQTQGLFINLCALYWSQSGNVRLSDAKRRHSDGTASAWRRLISDEIIKVKGDSISISFLDEQMVERKNLSEQNRKNALESHKNRASAQRTHSDGLQYREEEKREEKNLGADKSATHEKRAKDFYKTLEPYINKYSKKMLREFYDYWTEISPNAKKMRFEKESAFEVQKRLVTWAKRARVGEETKPTAENDFSEAQFWKDQMLPAAWIEKYDYQIQNNPSFKAHFKL